MKKYFYAVFALFMGAVLVSSCSQDDEVVNDSSREGFVKTTISNESYFTIVNEIKSKIDCSTRSLGEEFSEEEAQVILSPLVVDGNNIRNQLLDNSEELQMTKEDVELLSCMTDDQLAELSMVLNSLEISGPDDDLDYGSWEREVVFSTDDVIACILVATGFDSIGDAFKNGPLPVCISIVLSGKTKQVSAKTAMQIAKAIAPKVVGYIGVAWMIYDFIDCLNNKIN